MSVGCVCVVVRVRVFKLNAEKKQVERLSMEDRIPLLLRLDTRVQHIRTVSVIHRLDRI